MVPVGETRPASSRTGRWRTPVAAVLIVVGVVLAPIAVVATYASTQVTNTEVFVSTFAPLAQDADVQDLVIDETLAAIGEAVDVDALTRQLFDGLSELDLPPKAAEALGLLRGPAVAGIESLIRSIVTDVVTSSAFATVWEQSLRVTHEQMNATMQSDPGALLALSEGGTVGIQLGPIIANVKQQLVREGVTFASAIPEVERTIDLATSSDLVRAQGLYGLVVALGAWMPLLSLVLIVAGVVVARRPTKTLIVAAVALAAVMAVLCLCILIGRAVVLDALAPFLPPGAAGAIFDALVQFISGSAFAILIVALVVAIAGYLLGPFRGSAALSRLVTRRRA